MNRYSVFLVIIFLFSACSVKYDNNLLKEDKKIIQEVNELNLLINSLSKKINKEEAKDASFKAIKYSRELANKYNLVSPPSFHNLLVNMNLKNQGYCYHFANELMHYLQKQNYKTMKFKRVVANRSSYDEHSALIITRDEISLENSIVLDAWRNSGKLFYKKLKEDKEYIWEIK